MLCFHAECIHAARAHLQPDSVTGRMEVVWEPLVERICPTCRAPWSPADVNECILADFEDPNTTDDSHYGSGEEDDGDTDEEDDGDGDTDSSATKHWTKYVDPNTERAVRFIVAVWGPILTAYR